MSDARDYVFCKPAPWWQRPYWELMRALANIGFLDTPEAARFAWSQWRWNPVATLCRRWERIGFRRGKQAEWARFTDALDAQIAESRAASDARRASHD